MKALLPFLFLFGAASIAAEVRPGDSEGTVRAQLGAPRGELARGDRQVLVYERGEVELRNGIVAKVALRSPEEQEAYAERMAQENERARQENEIRRARMTAEGEALRDRKLADPNFLALPAGAQVSFWQDFAQAYPSVSITEILISARNRYSAELNADAERREQAERLAELEQRLAESEARMAEARNVVAPITTSPYYPIYRRPFHRRDRDQPLHSPGFFPIYYPDHIGLGSSPAKLPPPPRMGYDPLLPRPYVPSFDRRR